LFGLHFLADGMLGKLSRWLRIMGHNVDYYRDADDKTLIDLAESEKRILLTADLELYQQTLARGLNAFFVESTELAKTLAHLANHFDFKLEIDLNDSRCPKCNGNLEVVSKDVVIDKLPKATSTNYDEFWRCRKCGQVYWQGAHWKSILMTFEDAKCWSSL
jgi:uncharacterized protein with PIN domain